MLYLVFSDRCFYYRTFFCVKIYNKLKLLQKCIQMVQGNYSILMVETINFFLKETKKIVKT